VQNSSGVTSGNNYALTVAVNYTALAEVYVQGHEPQEKPRRLAKFEWALYLHRGRSQQGRAQIAAPLSLSLEAYTKSKAAFDRAPVAEGMKLDASIDDSIADNDPEFRKYISQWRRGLQEPDPSKRWIPAERKQYLDQKRADWWRNRIAKLYIVLSDPSLVEKCALPTLGVTVAGQR
jgi:hypothetical protein